MCGAYDEGDVGPRPPGARTARQTMLIRDHLAALLPYGTVLELAVALTREGLGAHLRAEFTQVVRSRAQS